MDPYLNVWFSGIHTLVENLKTLRNIHNGQTGRVWNYQLIYAYSPNRRLSSDTGILLLQLDSECMQYVHSSFKYTFIYFIFWPLNHCLVKSRKPKGGLRIYEQEAPGRVFCVKN